MEQASFRPVEKLDFYPIVSNHRLEITTIPRHERKTGGTCRRRNEDITDRVPLASTEPGPDRCCSICHEAIDWQYQARGREHLELPEMRVEGLSQENRRSIATHSLEDAYGADGEPSILFQIYPSSGGHLWVSP
ncbi:MAG: hypothetical protein ABI193_13430 [Minicystis sp.]